MMGETVPSKQYKIWHHLYSSLEKETLYINVKYSLKWWTNADDNQNKYIEKINNKESDDKYINKAENHLQ